MTLGSAMPGITLGVVHGDGTDGAGTAAGVGIQAGAGTIGAGTVAGMVAGAGILVGAGMAAGAGIVAGEPIDIGMASTTVTISAVVDLPELTGTILDMYLYRQEQTPIIVGIVL